MNKNIESIYKAVENKAQAFTRKELEDLIVSEGFDRNTAKDVIKELDKNNISFKGEKPQVKTEDKEQILKELSKSVKSEDTKKPKEKKVFKNPVSSIITFLKRIYFFFEDGYYSVIDGISKVVPINKLTDQIDKVFPSFVLFLALIVGLIWFLFFSGISLMSGGVSIVDVTVTDTTNSLLSGATVILSINDNNTTQTTDAFGNVVFEEISLKKKDEIKIIVSKEAYNKRTKTISEIKKNIVETIVLDIDTRTELFLSPEQTREIVFKENGTLLATKLLQIKFYCSNSGKQPNPTTANLTTGRQTVIQPSGCGELRVDVTSDYYNLIQNQIVPENNTIQLSLKAAANVGKIEAFVKDLQGNAITGASISVYKADDLTTPVNESNLVFVSGTSDHYGRYVFDNLSPGNYTLSTSKDGYISSQRTSELQVITNNTTPVNLLLFTPNDLQNINCQNPLMAQFCKNGCLDCNNSLLTNYYTRDINGNLIKTGNNCCQIGRIGYINVTLVDANGITSREVKGDITLFKKNTDNNGYQSIATRNDVNFANFMMLSGNYKITVTDTEDYGYFPSDPIDVNGIDRNISVPLEYSSVLNSGMVGVNVNRGGFNRVASVYLYNEDEPEFPQQTGPSNSDGDVNFTMVRANRDYFAFAVEGTYQGQSSTRELDANSFLQLNVNLESQAKILNLNVNVRDYNISFYSLTNNLIEDYTVNTISDTNKEYIFRCPQDEIYAIISADNKATYQTDIISLIPGQKIYYKVTLGNPQTNAHANLEFLGMYDESGITKLNSINLAEYRNKTLKFKYKFTTTTKNNRDLAYAFIRAGKFATISADFLRLETVFAPGATLTRGCNYHGELTDWDENYFTNYYNTDHTQTNCTNQTGYKWVKVNFSQHNSEQIEFSVNVKFQNGLTQLDNYFIYHRGLTKAGNDAYAFSPTLNNSWQNCTIRPQGYFYAKSNSFQIPFDNEGYNLLSNIYDWNNSQGSLILPVGNNYEFKINRNYQYTQKFLYLNATQNVNNKDINAYSTNTLNSLLYQSYIFRSRDKNVTVNETNVPTYKINNFSAQFGTEFDHNSIFKVNNFFSNNAKINTNILDIQGINPDSKNILSYYDDSNVFIEILTNDVNGSNNIYIGDNNISFRVRNRNGNPISNILIKYRIDSSNEIELGLTNDNGFLLDKNISFEKTRLGDNVSFIFANFPIVYGLSGNSITVIKTINSGYKLVHENGQDITTINPIVYNVGKFTINGTSEITKDKKNYYIVKNSAYNPTAEILISGRPGWINIVDTNNYLYTQNNLSVPVVVSDSNKQIQTQITLNSIPNNPTQVIGGYNNTLNIGSFGDQHIIFDLNADIKANKIFDINFNLTTEGLEKPGKLWFNNSPHIELIKNVNPSVDYNYVIVNNSNTPFVIDINFTKDQALSGVNIIVLETLTIPANGTRRINVKYELAQNASSTTEEKDVNLSFKYTVNGITFIRNLPQKIRVFNKDDIYVIRRNGSVPNPYWNQSMTCSVSDCNSSFITTFENKTRTYDFNLSNISFVDADNNFSFSSTNLSRDINSSNIGQVDTVISGIYGQLDNPNNNAPFITLTKNKIIKYQARIKNSDILMDVNAPLNLTVTVIKRTIQELLEEQGLYGNICLGFGSSGPALANNFDIIGICEFESFNNCKSGDRVKPKIKYDWSSTGWNTECIDDSSENYDINKTHCDSLQMLFSSFSLLTDLTQNEKYIYLMADGVSSDLLKDLISYPLFLSGGFNNTLDFNRQNPVLTLQKINDGNFTITKTEKINGEDVSTTKPGKYRLSINDSFRINQPSPLHIKLELVREMPYSMRNLLYYLPIDGKLGINESLKQTRRNGYGVSITGTDVNLPVTSGEQPVVIYDSNSSYNSFVKLTVNNNNFVSQGNQEGLRNTINSEGKLINIRLDAITEESMLLTIDYSPSYPIPIFAKVINGNTDGLNYRLKSNQQSNYPLKISSLIKWEDYNNSNKILKDDTFNTGSGEYFKSQVTPTTFRQAYGTNTTNKLLRTILYWPMSEKTNFTNMFFTLQDADLGNHNSTKIYTLSNLDTNGSKMSGNFTGLSKIGQDIRSYSDIFNLVYTDNAKACMESGLTSVIVRWNRESIDFNTEQIDKIILDYSSEPNTNDSTTTETNNE